MTELETLVAQHKELWNLWYRTAPSDSCHRGLVEAMNALAKRIETAKATEE